MLLSTKSGSLTRVGFGGFSVKWMHLVAVVQLRMEDQLLVLIKKLKKFKYYNMPTVSVCICNPYQNLLILHGSAMLDCSIIFERRPRIYLRIEFYGWVLNSKLKFHQEGLDSRDPNNIPLWTIFVITGD